MSSFNIGLVFLWLKRWFWDCHAIARNDVFF